MFCWPKVRDFVYSGCGSQAHAEMFAGEFARKGFAFFLQWWHAGSPSDFVYDNNRLAQYSEGQAFQQFMDSERQVGIPRVAYCLGEDLRELVPSQNTYASHGSS